FDRQRAPVSGNPGGSGVCFNHSTSVFAGGIESLLADKPPMEANQRKMPRITVNWQHLLAWIHGDWRSFAVYSVE
ncbi:MAG: hypothetical protein JAY69_05445, partial [Candidatus Thiodiazotropha taylori]|nr:hypothetical protein [Candidatus Thiodiazotropha taylori]MCW4232055.1 hypothetical protein [Candidatus Thiodiazotropha taylori]